MIVNTHSVPTPLALSGYSALVYYEPGTSLPTLAELVGTSEQAESQMSGVCRAALRVIFTHAMRATEYLRLTADDIITGDRVIVRGAKRSGSYLMHLPGIAAQFSGLFRLTRPPCISGLSYVRLYRSCVRANIGQYFTHHQNQTRTHLGRHLLVKQNILVRKAGTLGDCLRHRSPKSILYYA